MSEFTTGDRVSQTTTTTRHGRYAMSQTFRGGKVLDGIIFDGEGIVSYVDPATLTAEGDPDRGAEQGVATFTLTDEQVVILNDCLFEACNSEQATSDEIKAYIALRDVLAAQAYPQRPSARIDAPKAPYLCPFCGSMVYHGEPHPCDASARPDGSGEDDNGEREDA